MKKRSVTKLMSKLVALSLVAGLMVGSGNSKVEASTDEQEETVNLTIYTLTPEQGDQEKVIEVLNEYTKEKINITADWVFANGSYDEKMSIIIASGETYDACFTANWTNNYLTNVAKGAFVDITDMLQELTPDLYNVMPESFWEATKVNGKIYGIPNQQIAAKQPAISIFKEYADGVGYDWTQITGYDNIEEYAQLVYDKYGITTPSVRMDITPDLLGFESIGGYAAAGAIRMDDETATVVNIFETEEWLNLLNNLADLNAKGLLNGEFAYVDELLENLPASKECSLWVSGTVKPGIEVENEKKYGHPTYVNGTEYAPYLSTSGITATMYGISTTSEYPEETLKYLELINTDPTAINLISYGIEGEHYTKVSDNVISIISDAGYTTSGAWSFGNVYNSYVLEGQPENVHEQTQEVNNTAKVSPIIGFSFDLEPVKRQVTNVSKVVDEYESILSGELPVEETNAEFVEKLKVAGVDDIIAEMQSQIDAFLAAK